MGFFEVEFSRRIRHKVIRTMLGVTFMKLRARIFLLFACYCSTPHVFIYEALSQFIDSYT